MRLDPDDSRGDASFPLPRDLEASPPSILRVDAGDGLWRIAIHEAGHVIAARIFNFPISVATIVPDYYFAGKVRGLIASRIKVRRI